MRTLDNVFEKYIWLMNVLLRRPSGISLKEMNDLWANCLFGDGVHFSRTTFNRYRDALEEMFGVEIGCRRVGSEYLYYLEDTEPLRGNNAQTWMLRTLSVSGALQNSRSLQRRILLEDIPGGQEYLQLVIDAMTHGHLLQVTYRSFRQEEAKTFTLAPYCLKVFHQRWYVVGKSSVHKDDAVRVYALDRVVALEETAEDFVLPAGFDAASLFVNDFGVMCGGEEQVEDIVIRAYGSLVWYLRTLPLHPSQREVDTQERWSDFAYHLRPTYDFRQELLSQAEQLEILAPESLRDSFRKVLRAASYRNRKRKTEE